VTLVTAGAHSVLSSLGLDDQCFALPLNICRPSVLFVTKHWGDESFELGARQAGCLFTVAGRFERERSSCCPLMDSELNIEPSSRHVGPQSSGEEHR